MVAFIAKDNTNEHEFKLHECSRIMNLMGKVLIFLGLFFILIGIFFLFGEKISKIPFLNQLGKLPGDIRIEKENFRFYFPLATCIIISIILTLLLNLFGRR